MINLQAFISSMKATWLRRWIQTDSEWKDLNSNINFKKLFDFGKAYADSIIKQISNPFWEDVIKAYPNVLELNQQSTEDFALSSPTFFNHNILIGGKPVFFSQWYMKGITYINDIINNSGEFYSEQELKTKYSIKTNFLQVNGIIRSIKEFLKLKTDIKTFTKKLQQPILPTYLTVFVIPNKGCKEFYNILNKNNDKPTSQSKWENIYDIEEDIWKDIYSSPFKLNAGTNLQWFQTRINHRLLPTKKYLYTINATPSPLCNSCQVEEDIIHMLWTCRDTKCLITQLKTWLLTYNINITLSEELFIFIIGKNLTQADLQIIITTKYYIYLSKHLNSALSIVALKHKLRAGYIIDKHIATKYNRMKAFETKWQKYRELFDHFNRNERLDERSWHT